MSVQIENRHRLTWKSWLSLEQAIGGNNTWTKMEMLLETAIYEEFYDPKKVRKEKKNCPTWRKVIKPPDVLFKLIKQFFLHV